MSGHIEFPGTPSTVPKRYTVSTAFTWLCPLAVLVVAGSVYFLCLSNHLTQDSIAYIRSAITGEELLHPHHLLYNPLMRIVAVLLDGARIETIVAALQYANIVITLIAVLIVWFVVRRIGAPVWAAAVYTLFFALSGGLLVYSSQVEVYTVTVLFLAVAVLGLVNARSPWAPVLAAGGWFAAMLFHQTAIFFGIALIVHEMLKTGRSSCRRVVVIAGLPLVAIGVVYLTVCWFHHCSTLFECWQWITSYAQVGTWAKGTISCDTFNQGFGGMFEALGSGRGKRVAGLIGFIVAACILVDRRHVIENKALVGACSAWCAVQGIFSLWWFASNVEFWIFLLFPLTLCMAALAYSRKPLPRRSLTGMLAVAPIILIIFFGVLSAFDHYQRNSRPNRSMFRVARCAAEVAQKDTVITADNELKQYCRLYLQAERVMAFNLQIARQAIEYPGEASFTQNFISVLADEVRRANKHGAAVFIDRRIIQGTLNPIRLMSNFEADVFCRSIPTVLKSIPLKGQEPQWYEIQVLAEPAQASVYGFGHKE